MLTIGNARKVIFKILHARLQHYVNQELPDVQAGFRKERTIRDQTANVCWIIEKAREFQKNISLCFMDYAKAFDCVDHEKLWKALREMGTSDHLTCLLRNLYEVKKQQSEPCMNNWLVQDWERSTTGLSAVSLFMLPIHWAHQEKCQAGWITSWIKIGGRNINNLRYADDTTLSWSSNTLATWCKELRLLNRC